MNTIISVRRLSWMAVLLPVGLLLSQGRLSAQQDNAPAPVPAPPTVEAPKDAAPKDAPQSPQQNPTEPPQSTVVIRKESRLVLVDTVVTDKKGEYVRDLKQSDFKVYEDNKEQSISSFSTGSDPAIQASGQKRYLILFFDNSTMQTPDQIQARNAANQFIAANSDGDHLMAVVDFGGALRIVQNFTANADLLRSAVAGVKSSSVNPNANVPDVQPVTVASTGLSSLSNAEADFGARSVLLAVRSLAKNLRTVPGRKMLVLFSGGFALNPENQSELTATIDACNKSNVAIYALDARGLVGGLPGGSARLDTGDAVIEVAKNHADARSNNGTPHSGKPQLVLASFSNSAEPDPQRPGGGGAGAGAGGGRGTTGGTGTTGGAGGKGTTGGAGGKGTTGGTGTGTGTGTGRSTGGTTGTGAGTAPRTTSPSNFNFNSPYNQPRTIVPPFLPSASTNQQILAALAEGTGGFTIFNTNDLLGGLKRIGREQSEFYILGYVPSDTPEGACHTLKVKLSRGGTNVRSRSGYCNVRTGNTLEGKPVEKQLESRAAAAQAGSIHGGMQAPYFYTSANVARVNLAMEIPADAVHFNKEKGKYNANLNVLGIAYRADGSVGARFSDTVNLNLDKDEWKQFTQNPYRYENQFDASPGTYKLTVVLSAGGDAFGKFETPLQIDTYDGKHFSLGGVALANNAQKLGDIPTSLDAALLEDRTPLVVHGLQIMPSGTNRFKRDENVIVYSEIYEPLLTSDNPPKIGLGYRILDRASKKEVMFTGVVTADAFIQKGNPVVPVGLKVNVKDLAPGAYCLVMQAVDAAGNKAPNRIVDFDVM
ncbi:MAG TPA: VWA domain-containing protein [Methylomirabilota bacterium]|nr:VWA domain-containing protein [Methylomirabilota bacterium]